MGTMRSRHVSVWIEAAPEAVYAYAADPHHLQTTCRGGRGAGELGELHGAAAQRGVRPHLVLRRHRDLARYYTRKNISISLLRAARKRDMEGVLSLYGTDEQRYW